MNRSDYDNFIDPSELSLDAILAEYKAEAAAEEKQQKKQDDFKKKSRRIVMEALDETMSAQLSDTKPEPAYEPEVGSAPEYIPEEIPKRRGRPVSPAAEPEYEENKEVPPTTEESGYSDEDEPGYAGADYPEYEDKEEDYGDPEEEERSRDGFSFMQPIIALLAAIMVRRQQRQAEEAAREDPQEEAIPEIPPAKAAKLYASQAKPFKFRGIMAAALCVLLLYISYGYGHFPMPYSISGNIKIAALLCMLLELVVILTGLDIFTNGITTLLRGRPGAETLISVSCVFSMADALVIAITGSSAGGLPFCAVSSLSLAFGIWGSRLLCRGMRATFRTAASASSPFVMSAEREITEDGSVIIKTRRDISGFVRRSEEADASETANATAAPFILIAALVFSVMAGFKNGSFLHFLHTLSALTAVSASFSSLLSFSLPFSLVARRLAGGGAAIAGWAGASDIGKSRHTVVTDTDVFPPGTVGLDTIRILEGTFTDKVISYTGSMMIAAGCSLTPAFAELMKRNGCAMQPIEDFKCHEGGGIIGLVRGEQVYVGTSGFMNLMGIRLPQSQISKDAVFTAISGELVGVFATKYVATASVQDALVTMLHSRGCSPLFAIRDFNISPLLIKQKFHMPTESFNFPSVSERYRISGTEASEDSSPAAVISREGLGPMVEAAIGGTNVYRATRLSAAISLTGTLIGIILMFFLCWTGSFDSAGVVNMLTFMLLRLVPDFVIAIGLRR